MYTLSFFTIHETDDTMCDTEGNKHICILYGLFDCQQYHQHPPEGKETNIMVYKFKIIFLKRKLHLLKTEG